MTHDLFKKPSHHKNCFTSYEVLVPKARYEDFIDNMVWNVDAGIVQFGFCKFDNYKKLDRVFNELRTNYERECGDLERYCRSDTVYFLVGTEALPGLKKSYKCRYLGFIEVHDHVIQVIWIHPFIRNKGIVSSFLFWYGLNQDMLSFQPPLTKQFQGCVKKIGGLILNNPAVNESQTKFWRRYFCTKIDPKIVENLTDEEFKYARSVVIDMHVIAEKKMATLPIEQKIKFACEMAGYIHRNPDVKEELTNFALKNVDKEAYQKAHQDFMNYGERRD